MRRITLFGLDISDVQDTSLVVREMEKRLNKPDAAWLVTFVNPHSWFVRESNQDYTQYLEDFDLVLADGIGVVKAAQWLSGDVIKRLSFDASSLYHPVLSSLNERSSKLYVVGGHDGVAVSAAKKINERFPCVCLVGLSDGYRSWDKIITDVLRSEAETVLCGMGAPHQEAFLLALKKSGFKGVAFTCGGFLDQLAAKEQYYPVWIDAHNLRWAYRIYKEPRRLLQRYAFQYQPFIKQTLAGLLRSTIQKALPDGPARLVSSADIKPPL
ncbi:MAG: WecB/TagA/CpsF family glycosyltransferase [Cyanobacteria bacterium J06638_22]